VEQFFFVKIDFAETARSTPAEYHEGFRTVGIKLMRHVSQYRETSGVE